MAKWTFYTFEEAGSGKRPFEEWLADQTQGAQAHIEEKIAHLEDRRQWNEKLAKPYQGRDGIFEFRPTYKKVPFRPLMCRHPKDPRGWVFLEGAIENNWSIRRSHLDVAERRRAELMKDDTRAKPRD